MEVEGLGMLGDDLLTIGDDQRKVATTACTWHLPGKDTFHLTVLVDGLLDIGAILLFMTDIGWRDHAWEHSDLRIEAGFVGSGKGGEVFGDDGIPASFGGIGKVCNFLWGDVFVFHY